MANTVFTKPAVCERFAKDRDLRREATAVDDFVGEVLDAYHVAEGIELSRDLDCPDQIFADRNALRLVLVELLDNAMRSLRGCCAQPAGRRRECLVSTQFITTHVLLTVSDNGPGIAREALPTIFETGVGLPAVRQVVERHGGTVDIHSDAGQGTTVTIWLPRHRAARPAVRVAAAA